MLEIVRGWLRQLRLMERRSPSGSWMYPAASVTGTWSTQCSPPSMPATTPRTGPTWSRGIIRRGRISTCTGCNRSDGNPCRTGTRVRDPWNDSQPIYRQLRDRVVAMILDAEIKEGDPLPSVRTVAADYRVNPLTVLKAYQQLADEQIVEKRRGIGMFISAGVREQLLRDRRKRFLSEDWPGILATIRRLGLTPEELLDGAGGGDRSQEKPPAKGRR